MRLLPALLLLLLSACAAPPTGRLPLLIDADTANEIDDLYAIVRALHEPRFDLRGLTSAQFHTSPLAGSSTVAESQAMNVELLRRAGRSDLPHPVGSPVPLAAPDRPAASPAADFIIAQAHALPEAQRLHIAVLGPCTNVASAILQDPAIVPRLVVHYIGFWHDPLTNVYDKKEFNSGNDTLAIEVLLDTPGLDLRVMTATTSQHLVFERTRAEATLRDCGPTGQYLLDRWATYPRWWTQDDPAKRRWIMWDVAVIEALAHPEWATLDTLPAPPENGGRPIGIYTAIDTAAMQADYWAYWEAHFGGS